MDGYLRLREPLRSDLVAVAEIAGDPRTSRYVPGGAVTDRDACDHLLRRWINDWATERIGYWLVEHRGAEAVIGWGGVRFVEAGELRLLNMAYRVALPYWGRGIATYVAERARAIAGERFPEIPVIARTAPENGASERRALKAGLQHVGCDRRGWYVLADRPIDVVVLNELPPA
jgi:RimJ/RimL family protein N-acetyltransferase